MDFQSIVVYFGKIDSVITMEMMACYDNGKSKIDEFIRSNNIPVTGPPVTLWKAYRTDAHSVFVYAYPVEKEVSLDNPDCDHYYIPSGEIIRTVIRGKYEDETAAWVALRNYMEHHKLCIRHIPYEEFVIGRHNETDTTKWVTNAVYPVTIKEVKKYE